MVHRRRVARDDATERDVAVTRHHYGARLYALAYRYGACVAVVGQQHVVARYEGAAFLPVGGGVVPRGLRRAECEVRHVGVYIHDARLHLSCGGRERSIVRLDLRAVLCGKGCDAHRILRGLRQSRDGRLRSAGLGAGHLCPRAVLLLELHYEALLGVGIVTPSEGQRCRRRRRQLCCDRLAEEEVAVVRGDAVDVVLYVEVAVAGQCGGVVSVWVGAVGRLPRVRHTVAVGVGGLFAGVPLPCVGRADGQRCLVCDECATGAVRHQLVNHIAVRLVAVGQ